MGRSAIANRENWDSQKPKNSTVATPLGLCHVLANLAWIGNQTNIILDLGCGDGRLGLAYKYFNPSATVIGIDIEWNTEGHPNKDWHLSNFIQTDWLTYEYPAGTLPTPDIVVMNPPWNNGKGKRVCVPELWSDRVWSSFGPKTKLVMISPMGFRLNQRRTSKRYKKYIGGIGNTPYITSILSLPIDAFSGVLFHSEVLFWNMEMPFTHSWYNWEFVDQMEMDFGERWQNT
jgi:hypothetical protein